MTVQQEHSKSEKRRLNLSNVSCAPPFRLYVIISVETRRCVPKDDAEVVPFFRSTEHMQSEPDYRQLPIEYNLQVIRIL